MPLSWSYWRIAASPCSHHLKASVTEPTVPTRLGSGTPGTGCAAAGVSSAPVSYTHLRAHETSAHL
eukprot:1545560-Alexandrium_andersonii.AAC.1